MRPPPPGGSSSKDRYNEKKCKAPFRLWMIFLALKLPGTIPQCRCHCWRVSGKKDASIEEIALGEMT